MSAIAGLLFAAWRLGPRHRLASFCILWFLGNLVIESSIIGLEIIFDHRTYLPSMMVCLIAVALLSPRLRRPEKALAHFSDAIRLGHHVSEAHFNIGNVRANQGRYQEAAGYFSKALKLNPKDREAQQNLKKVRELIKRNGALRSDAGHSNKKPG